MVLTPNFVQNHEMTKLILGVERATTNAVTGLVVDFSTVTNVVSSVKHHLVDNVELTEQPTTTIRRLRTEPLYRLVAVATNHN